MMLDCDRLWTELVTRVYRLRRLPRITNDPPPLVPDQASVAPGTATKPRERARNRSL